MPRARRPAGSATSGVSSMSDGSESAGSGRSAAGQRRPHGGTEHGKRQYGTAGGHGLAGYGEVSAGRSRTDWAEMGPAAGESERQQRQRQGTNNDNGRVRMMVMMISMPGSKCIRDARNGWRCGELGRTIGRLGTYCTGSMPSIMFL